MGNNRVGSYSLTPPLSHKLIQSAVETIYEPVDVKEFKKYSKSETGTVVIFSDWLPGEFDELLRD